MDIDVERHGVPIYRVRNDGPQDLDNVIVYRPRPPDGIKYPIAITGHDWASDEINLGPLPVTGQARFTLCCNVMTALPEFRVRVECWAGKDSWLLSAVLPSPKPRLIPTPTDEGAP